MIKMFTKFAIVGLSGVVINIAVYSLIILFLPIDIMIAAAAGFVFAVTNNFYWNFIWTFKNRAKDKSTRRKYIQFFLISFINFLIGLGVLKLMMILVFENSVVKEMFLTYGEENYSKISKILSQFVAIGMSSIINFAGNYKITFRRTKEKN